MREPPFRDEAPERGSIGTAAVIVAGVLIFLLFGIFLAITNRLEPADIGVISPSPPATPETQAACALGHQLASNGLLTQAEAEYSGALPTPSGTGVASATESLPAASASPNCGVQGLRWVNELRWQAAELTTEGDVRRANGEPSAAASLYRKALQADAGNAAAAEGLRSVSGQRGSDLHSNRIDRGVDTPGLLKPLVPVILSLLSVAIAAYLLVLLTKVAARVPWPLSLKPRSRRTLGLVAIAAWLLTLVTFVSGLLLAVFDWRGWRWLVAGAMALALGAVAVGSWYWRLRIGLQLEVCDEKGDLDRTSTAHLAERLRALGTEPPDGIRMTRQTDVTGLPETALSVLPGGSYFAVAVRVLSANVVVSPWRATVTLIDPDRVSVVVERHGHLVAREVADRRQLWFRDAKPTDMPDLGNVGLLTIAAAIILCAMATAHTQLRYGLSGARRWESIAGQVIATTLLSPVDHPNARAALLARAVDFDEDNFAARLALLQLSGDTATDSTKHRVLAEKMTALCAELAGRGLDQERALYLRTLHDCAAAWLNTVLFRRAEVGVADDTAWRKATYYRDELVARLCSEPGGRAKTGRLDTRMQERAGWLSLTLLAVRPPAIPPPPAVVAGAGRDDTSRPILVTAASDGVVARCDPATGDLCGEPLRGQAATGIAASRSDDGWVLVTVGATGAIERWSAATGDRVGEPIGDATSSTAVAACHAGGTQYLARVRQDLRTECWNLTTAKFERVLPTCATAVAAYAIGGKAYLAEVSAGTAIRVWNLGTGKEVSHWRVACARAIAAYTHDGKTVLVSSDDEGVITRWNPLTGDPVLPDYRIHPGVRNPVRGPSRHPPHIFGLTAYVDSDEPILAVLLQVGSSGPGEIRRMSATTGRAVGRPWQVPRSVTAITAFNAPVAEAWVAEVVGSSPERQYEHACLHAARRDYARSLNALQQALAVPEFKRYARVDASFAELRDVEKAGQRGRPTVGEVEKFYELVGAPRLQRFTALSPFAKHDQDLQAIGLREAVHLLDATARSGQRRRLARQLRVPEATVLRWRRIAELNERLPEPKLAYLDLLLAMNVDSPEELFRRTGGGCLDTLAKELNKAAFDHAVAPPTPGVLKMWARRAWPNPLRRR
jgi:uncharacterized protein DUF4332